MAEESEKQDTEGQDEYESYYDSEEYKETRKKQDRDHNRHQKLMLVLFICMIPMILGSAWTLLRTMSEDPARATFMLECMHEHDLSVEECEGLLKGE